MSFYSETAAIAHEVLREFGAPVTLTRSVAGAYDTLTGTTAAPAVTAYTGTGAAFEYAANLVNGTLIMRGDQRCYLSTVGVINPMPGDTLTIGAVTYTVIESRPLQAALISLLFDCQIRGVMI